MKKSFLSFIIAVCSSLCLLSCSSIADINTDSSQSSADINTNSIESSDSSASDSSSSNIDSSSADKSNASQTSDSSGIDTNSDTSSEISSTSSTTHSSNVSNTHTSNNNNNNNNGANSHQSNKNNLSSTSSVENQSKDNDCKPQATSYTSSNLGLSMTFPADWHNKYKVSESGNSISVYFKGQSNTDNNSGLLFTIIKKTDSLDESMYDSVGSKKYITLNNNVYFIGGPTDVNLSENDPDFQSFLKMNSEREQVINSIH